MLYEYAHWKNVEIKDWPWDNFLPSELACNGTGELKVETDLLVLLTRMRNELGGPLIVNSCYRSPSWNEKVGGAKNSQHLISCAADLRATRWGVKRLEGLARDHGAAGIGLYDTFVHVDVRTSGPAFWDYRS